MKPPRIIASAVLLAVLVLFSGRVQAQKQSEKGTFGVGLIIGEPTGVAAKLYLDAASDMALAAAIGPALAAGGLHAHLDVIWHPWILTTEDQFVLPAYIGVGIRVLDHSREGGEEDDFHIGPRAVGGILFDFIGTPLDVFAEIAGVIEFRSGGGDSDHRGTALDLNVGAGLRYYF
jgi:hypothetical protein